MSGSIATPPRSTGPRADHRSTRVPLRTLASVAIWMAIACIGAFVWFFQDTPLLNDSALASRVHLDAARMTHDEGLAFICPSRWLGHGDDVDRPRSAIRLYEDGIELSPARAKHDVVRHTGGGAWSHWTTSIFFSSTDGSDPRTNGRRYEARGLTLPVRWGSMLLALFGAVMAIRSITALWRGRSAGNRTEVSSPDDQSAPNHAADAARQSTTPGDRARLSPTRRVALVLASLAVSGLLIVLLLGALEVVLRMRSTSGARAELRLASGIGWERAGSAYRTIEPGARSTASSDASDGARRPMRVIFTGDSFAHDKTWGDKTVTAMHERGISIVGFEAGVSGYGTTQTLMQLRRLLPELQPDAVVILFYGWNDLRDNWSFPAICYNPRMTLRPYLDEQGVIHEPSSAAIALKQLELWKQVLEPVLDPWRVSRARERLRDVGVDGLASARERVVLGYDAEESWRPFYDPAQQHGAFVSGAWNVTGKAFEAIRELCAERGVALLVVGIDNPFTVDKDVADRWLAPPMQADEPLRRLASLLSELGVDFVDAVPALRAQRDRLGGAKQFDGDAGNIAGHLLPEAEAALAEAIVPWLEEVSRRRK